MTIETDYPNLSRIPSGSTLLEARPLVIAEAAEALTEIQRLRRRVDQMTERERRSGITADTEAILEVVHTAVANLSEATNLQSQAIGSQTDILATHEATLARIEEKIDQLLAR